MSSNWPLFSPSSARSNNNWNLSHSPNVFQFLISRSMTKLFLNNCSHQSVINKFNPAHKFPKFFVCFFPTQANNDDTVVQGSFEDFAELVSRYPGIVEQNKKQLLAALNTEGRGFLWPALFVGAQILSTSTKYTYTTSTITSTSVISCIPSASFYGGSTQACRRKRSIVDIEAHEDQMPFNPRPCTGEFH